MKDQLLKLVECTRWRIFPCKLVQEGGAAVKKPCIKTGTGYENASNDLEQVKEWWRRFDATMYGIVTGRMNNIVVLDVDHHSDSGNGFETLMELAAKGLEIPETLQVATPSGGLHYYFKNPTDQDIHNSAGKIGAGLDIRGNGGFIVGFMSRNNIGEYKLIKKKQLAEMPDWLVELCQRDQSTLRTSSKQHFSSGGTSEKEVAFPEKYAEKVFYSCCDSVEKAESGTRNDTLFKNAAKLYSYSAGGCFSDEMIESEMMKACQINGLIADNGRGSIVATLKSAKSHGYAQPIALKRKIEQ